MLGAAAARHRLADGHVEGDDPLAHFSPRAAQHLLRADGFAHCPDLYVNSFYDPDLDEGCAFEELISFHGGMGGLQTRPFILFPEELPLPDEPIVGAAHVHELLKGWRYLLDGTRARRDGRAGRRRRPGRVSPAPGRARNEVVLVRHGETDWSRAGRHTGRTDVPLNDAGPLERARALAATLADAGVRARAHEPARHGQPRRAGSPASATARRSRRRPDGVGLRRLRGAHDARDPGRAAGLVALGRRVAGGETAADVGARADGLIPELEGAEGDVAVFAHGHLLRVLGARWAGLPPADGRLLALDPAGLSVLGHEHDWRALRTWNARGLDA